MESTKYSAQLKRLQEEQEKALKETNERIKQWQTFKSDYDALKNRLETLPDKLSHDVMVPFGKLAFMPGQLVHTNEILVLLGDNWFAERSAAQAAEIIDRRMKTVDDQLEDLLKQRKLLEPRREFTSELQSMTEDGDGVMDIREEYDEEREKNWKETHKKNVQRHRRHLREEKKQSADDNTSTKSNQSAVTDEELWARLDQLEQIELERREMQRIGMTESEDQSHPLDLPWSKKSVELRASKGSEENHQELNDSSKEEELDSDDEEEEADDEEDGEVLGGGRIIHFHHTKNKPPSTSEAVCTSLDISEKETIESPADIYTKFSSCFGPRSILKAKTEPKKEKRKKTRERKVAFESDIDSQVEADTKQVSPDKRNGPQQTAFSGMVVEKPLPNTSLLKPSSLDTMSKADSTYSSAVEPESKPVSRFRAQRLGKNTS